MLHLPQPPLLSLKDFEGVPLPARRTSPRICLTAGLAARCPPSLPLGGQRPIRTGNLRDARSGRALSRHRRCSKHGCVGVRAWGLGSSSQDQEQEKEAEQLTDLWQHQLLQMGVADRGRLRGTLKRYAKLVSAINSLEPALQSLSDDQLRAKTDEFRERLAGGEGLESLQVESFAVVREASRRVLGMRPYDVQLFGGMVLFEGKVAEIRTGEGKTLVAALPAYLMALTGRGVHVVTVNHYLAARDAQWVGKVFSFLGLTVGVLRGNDPTCLTKHTVEEQLQAAAADITYTTSGELAFTVLLDNTGLDPSSLVLRRPFHAAIVDEADSVLVDESVNPSIVSMPSDEPLERFPIASEVADQLRGVRREKAEQPRGMFESVRQWVARVEEQDGLTGDDMQAKGGSLSGASGSHSVHAGANSVGAHGVDYYAYTRDKYARLTRAGEERVVRLLADLGAVFLAAEGEGRAPRGSDLWRGDDPWGPYVLTAIKTREFFKLGVDYAIVDGEAKIIGQNTGRLQTSSRWFNKIHQSIEAMNGLEVQPQTVSGASITYQVLFSYYPRLCGMTGTAQQAQGELSDIYGLAVAAVPTHRPLARVDRPILMMDDVDRKWDVITRDVRRAHDAGRPVLLCTASLVESVVAAERYFLPGGAGARGPCAGIPCQLLNANPRQAAREAKTIAQAGMVGSVTVATSMAGRGTDILLGGNPKLLALMALEDMFMRDLAPPPTAAAEAELQWQPNRPPGLDGISSLGALLASADLPDPIKAEALTVSALLNHQGGAGRASSEAEAEAFLAEVVEQAEECRGQLLTHRAGGGGGGGGGQDENGGGSPPMLTVMPLRCEDVPLFVISKWRRRDSTGGGQGDGGHGVEGEGGGRQGMRSVLQQRLVALAVMLWLWLDERCREWAQQVRAVGGLLVIGTSLHENARVEMQLRGRAGRQGDPGESRMLCDVSDPLLVKAAVQVLFHQQRPGVHSCIPPRFWLENSYSLRAFNEGELRAQRQNLKERDEVVDPFRRHIYALRRLLLCGSASQREQALADAMARLAARMVPRHTDPKQHPSRWRWDALREEVHSLLITQPGLSVAYLSPASLSTLVQRHLGLEPCMELGSSPERLLQALMEAESPSSKPRGLLAPLLRPHSSGKGQGGEGGGREAGQRDAGGGGGGGGLDPEACHAPWHQPSLRNKVVLGRALETLRASQGTCQGQQGGSGGRYAAHVELLQGHVAAQLLMVLSNTEQLLIKSRRSYALSDVHNSPMPGWRHELLDERLRDELDQQRGQYMVEMVSALWTDFLADADSVYSASNLASFNQERPGAEFAIRLAALFEDLLANLDERLVVVVHGALLSQLSTCLTGLGELRAQHATYMHGSSAALRGIQADVAMGVEGTARGAISGGVPGSVGGADYGNGSSSGCNNGGGAASVAAAEQLGKPDAAGFAGGSSA